MIAALSIGLVTATWDTLTLGLLISGLVMLGIWLLFQGRIATQQAGSWWRSRSLQTGTNAIISTVAVVVILGLVNFLGVRYSTQVDFTEAKQFSLAAQSKQVVETLKQPVKVLIFDTSADPQSRTLLERYQRLNPKDFSFEFIDPQAQPGLARQYDVRTVGEVVLESGDRTKRLDTGLSETTLTPAISGLVSDRKIKAYFVQGHGEIPLTGDQESLTGVVSALEREGTVVEPLNLSTQKQIPEDTNVLVIAGPQQPFLAPEIKELEAYLNGGGRVLFMIDPEVSTGLDDLLQQWGVALDSRIIVDGSSARPIVPLITQYGEHPITQNFARRLSFYPAARAIIVKENQGESDLEQSEAQDESNGQEKEEQQESKPQVTPLLFSSELSWAESEPENENLQPDPPQDLEGPLTLGVAITKDLEPKQTPQQEQGKDTSKTKPVEKQARLVVIGDSDFARTVYFEQELNGDVLLNAVNWLSSDETNPTLSIRPKEPVNRRLELNTQQNRLVSLLSLGLLPLAAFGTAAGLWWQRR